MIELEVLGSRFWVLGAGFGMFRAAACGMTARHYQDLVCWQLANELKLAIYAFTARSQVTKDFKYCDQIRDSARSGPRTIAEGFGRYRPADFARYLEFARASLTETHNHLVDGRDLNYLPPGECDTLCRLCDRASGATMRLMQYLHGCKGAPGAPRRTRNRRT
jgi:four helix bundle protein